MKQVSKTEEIGGDRGIDRLLRLETRQKPPALGVCASFDADLASAYAERALTAAENERYETHLAQCAPCRRAVTVLIRTAEPVSAISDRKPAREVVAAGSASDSWWRRLGGALMTPQWGLAAAAVLVLTIALPLIFSSRYSHQYGQQNGAGQDSTPATVASEPPTAPSADTQTQVRGLQANAPASGDADDRASSSARRADAQPGGTPTGVAGGAPATSAGYVYDRAGADKPQPADQVAARKEEARENEAQVRDAQLAARVSEQPKEAAKKTQAEPSAPAPAPESAERNQRTEIAKIDEKQAQRMPQQDQDSARVSVLKQGRADAGEREQKDAKIRPEDAVPPPPPASGTSSSDMRARRGLSQSSRMAMTEPSAPGAKPAKPLPKRETKGKSFWLRDDIWTDKDYNPLKELPVITLVRDSDVYREVLNKRGGLKPYFQLFSGTDRAIVVYKGTVYKLIPVDGGR